MKDFFSNNPLIALAVVVFVFILAMLWPFAIIWSLNALFPLLSIPYSFISWAAVVILNLSTFGAVVSTIRNKD